MSFGKFRSDDPDETYWQSAEPNDENDMDRKWSRGNFMSSSGINKQRSTENRVRLMKNRFEQNRGNFNFSQQRRGGMNESRNYSTKWNHDNNNNNNNNTNQYNDQITNFQGGSFSRGRGYGRSDRSRGRGRGRGRGGRGRGRGQGNNFNQRNNNNNNRNNNSGKRWIEKKKPTEKELDRELEIYYTGGGDDGKERTEQMLDNELKEYYQTQPNDQNATTNPTAAPVEDNKGTNENTNNNPQPETK